jgi:nucleotide-binding universal stress UspA family protein
MYRRLLVPLDGSTLAEEALPHALNLARRSGGELVLLRVIVSPYAIVAPDLVLAGTDPNLPELNQQAQQYLDALAVRLSGDASVRAIVCEGPVAEAILEHAVALDVDLIVMSTHGRGGVSRWVYGSVAERVLQGSVCPVLLIRSAAVRS